MINKLINKEKDAKRQEEKKQKKRIHRFKSLIRDAESFKEGATWEEVRKEIEGDSYFNYIEDESQRVSIFNELLAKLKERGSEVLFNRSPSN